LTNDDTNISFSLDYNPNTAPDEIHKGEAGPGSARMYRKSEWQLKSELSLDPFCICDDFFILAPSLISLTPAANDN
jgi:hypothetical protein